MSKLALVFPGIGYTVDKPLLYFSRKIAAENGYEIKLLPYTGFPPKILGDREKMTESYRIALSQSREMLSDVDFTAYDEFLFIGKSIGTAVAAQIAAEIPRPVRLLLYTPLEETFLFPLKDSIVFTGLADPWVGKESSRIPQLCEERGIPCHVVPGATGMRRQTCATCWKSWKRRNSSFHSEAIGLQYQIIRSARKTLSIQIKPEGVIVRAPLRATDAQIERFVQEHSDWIEKHLKKMEVQQKKLADVEPLSMEEIRALADQALKVIPERVKYYAPKIGVTYGRITIRNQRSKWGSCSAKGNLNFNCLLMLTPPEVIDSVVVHELCHRKEMNHSDRFYAEVLRVFPDYWKWHRWLKENGNLLMLRMTAGKG